MEQKNNDFVDSEELTPVQKFYDGKTIFITGATGFIGKVLLEKLIRCCPGISTVYVMVREKKGKTAGQRVEEIFRSELFNLVKEKYPDVEKKVFPIYGDLGAPSFGISDQDRLQITNSVQIVFHTAARVTWDKALRSHVRDHVVATSTLLDLIKDIKHIEAFVHVSTVAVHRESDFTVLERVGKKPVSPEQLIDALKWMDDDVVKVITPYLIKDSLMTYTLVKALAENVIEDNHGHVPCAIVRSSYTTPTIKEPFPGWCDAIQALQGVTLAMWKGYLRAGHLVPKYPMALTPVDLFVNTLITSAWHIASTGKSLLVVNCALENGTLGTQMSKELMEFIKSYGAEFPLSEMFRYPNVTLHSSEFLCRIHAFFEHYIPAVIIDILLFVFTGKTKMLKAYDRIYTLTDTYMKCCEYPWHLKLENSKMIREQLSKKDTELFFMDAKDLDGAKYMESTLAIVRRLLAKEDPSNVSYARKKAKRLLFYTTVLKWAVILFALFCVYSSFSTSTST